MLLPLLGAILHPPMGWLFQKGEREGLPMSVTVGVSNLATVFLFPIYLRPDWSLAWSWLDALAIANGLLFFFGQWFSVQAVKSGDLIVHSSALGIKLLLVASLSIALGLEQGSLMLVAAVALGALAIFLLAGGDVKGWRQHRKTLGWTLVGTVFYGVGDVFTSWKAAELDMARWLILMMAGSGSCAIVALWPQRRLLRVAVSNERLRWVLVGLGLLMSSQAILINSAFALFQKPTVTNIVFSIRGLLAVPFLMLIRRQWKGVVRGKTLTGAFLMLAALALAAFS